MTGKTDKETIAVYDAQAETYLNTFANHEILPSLDRFIALCPSGGKVLDLGCGPGHHAAKMHAHGLKVTATDASTQMVQLARQHDGVNVRQATFDDLQDQAIYNGVWAHFSLLHAPRADFPEHLSRIYASLNPSGIFHIGLKTGTGEERDQLGRQYTYFTLEELCMLLEGVGFFIIDQTLGESAGLAGTIDPWVEILTRKA